MKKQALYILIFFITLSCNTTKKTKKSKTQDSITQTTHSNVVDTIKKVTTTTKPTTTSKPIDSKIQKILTAIAANELSFTNFYAKIKTKAMRLSKRSRVSIIKEIGSCLPKICLNTGKSTNLSHRFSVGSQLQSAKTTKT